MRELIGRSAWTATTAGNPSGGRRAGAKVAAAAAAVAEALERRTLLAATPTPDDGVVAGVAWDDVNGDRARQASEPLLAGWRVYLDEDRSATREATEPSVLTGPDGSYRFDGLAQGRHFVAVELPVGWEHTTPTTAGAATAEAPATNRGRVPAPVTFTGSAAAAYPTVATAGGAAAPVPADAQADALIRLTPVRTDPRFAAADGAGYSVAVLDTGIDPDHPAFGPDADGNGVADRIVYQHDFGDDDPDATDVNGHGTHVAGTVAGEGPLTTGVAPAAGVVALKVFPNSGAGTFGDIERALQWVVANAAAHKIAAVNMSLSDSQNHSAAVRLYGLDDELAALAGLDVIVVSAAGNSFGQFGGQQGVGYPAADPNSLAVGGVYDAAVGSVGFAGATDHSTGPDRVMSLSQRSTVLTDVMAPGGAITGAAPGGGTTVKYGTSMAAPHVAGAAALAQQLAVRQLGRRLAPAEFRQVMRDTAATVRDGDDEDDNVANTGADFPRLDVLGLQQAIYAIGRTVPYAWTVDLPAAGGFAGVDFGSRRLSDVPDRPDLVAATDTGVSATDDLTNHDNRPGRPLTFDVRNTIPGATVLVYADGVQVGSAVAAATSTRVTTAGGYQLSAGPHEVTARQTVPDWATSAASPGLTVRVDAAAPAQPAAPTLVAASDTGASAADRVTADASPTFAFATGPGTYFRFQVDGAYVASGYDVGTAYTPRFVVDGTHQFRVQAVDEAGNASLLSPATQVTVDTQASPAPPTAIDPAFGQAGGVGRSTFEGWDAAFDSAVQPDGKVVVAGYSPEPGTKRPQVSLARFLPDGRADASFGTGGRVDARRYYHDEYHAVAVQPDGKILAGGVGGVQEGAGYRMRYLLERYNPDGTLDATFGPAGTGRVFAPFPTTHFVVEGIVVRPDGRIVTLTTGNAGGRGFDYGLVGLLPDGRIDPAFGSDGRLIWDLNGQENPVALAAAPDGGLVVLGTTAVGTSMSAFVARHLPDGRRDPAFGDAGSGVRVLRVAAAYTHATALAVQPDGKVVFGGRVYPQPGGTQTDGYVARLLPGGGDDPSFGTGGVPAAPDGVGSVSILRFGAAANSDVLGLAVTPDGRVAVAGSSGYGVLARLRPDGHPDTAFAPGGHLITTLPLGNNSGSAVHPTPDGRLVYAGTVSFVGPDPYGGADFALFRSQAARGPLAPVLQSASDSGSPDGVTDVDALTFDLPAGAAGPYFRVYRDGALLLGGYRTGTAFTDPAAPEGPHRYAVTSVDLAGNESAVGDAASVLVDRVGPVATFDPVESGPADGPVNQVTLRFDEPPIGLALDDLTLTRDGGPNLMTAGPSVRAVDARTYLIENLAGLTAEPGSYALALAAGGVTDDRGRPGGPAVVRWVRAVAPPAADAGGPYATAEGGQVVLAGTATAPTGTTIAGYEWDLDYDGASFSVDATGASPAFSAAGIDGLSARTVAVRARDGYGRTGAVGTAVVAVTNAPPTATFAAGPAVAVGTASAVAFTGAADPSPADAAAGFRYSFDFNADGDFDDAGDVRDSASPAAAFAFAAAGAHTVRGRIADKDGGYSDYVAVATVTPPAVPSTLSLRAAADAHAVNGPLANTNLGNGGELQVRLSSFAGQWRESFLRFDLSQVAAADRVTSARLRLTGRLSQAGSLTLGLFPVTAGGGWAENGLTWNNKPVSGNTAVAVLKTLTSTTTGLHEFDVTGYLKQQKAAGAAAVTFVVKATNYTTPHAIFASDEAASGRPELRVAQQGTAVSPPPPAPPVVPPPPPPVGGSSRLAGAAIGTAGSYNNGGNTIARALDNNLGTYFDAPATAASGAWVGLDLGSAKAVTSVTFAPRASWAGRMVGGRFQASNTADFSAGVVDLHTVAVAPPSSTLTTISVSAAGGFRYVRYLAPANSYGNVAEVQFFGQDAGGGTVPPTSPPPTSPPVSPPPPPPAGVPADLTGAAIGTSGSYNNGGNTIARALDGNLSTYFDAPATSASNAWVGLDLGSARAVTQVRFAPRGGWAGRMVGGRFQASDSATFASGVVDLHTVTAAPAAGVLTTVNVNPAGAAYRHVRYLAPANSYGNVAEVQFVGT